MEPKVDAFLSRATQWQKEMEKLRKIVLDCGLTEELKWGKPCYTFQGKNIVVIQGFKEYCALLFLKGFLLKNADGILVKTGENTRVGRQARFTSTKEIVRLAPILKSNIYEAIEVEKSGVKGPAPKPEKLKIPEEFQIRLDKTPALKTAFNALTPGRQRAYIFYFSQPKQSATRASRVEKCLKQILRGEGLNERRPSLG
ncbi:MAG TPA: YdeI/OmpD-associated family protein [Puia sp.]|jgi:uncharacterized protein YdeI (YjbR/CyaY-like superfamily)|nr:YdeI/OmpD-associated family protein [Puia sp.]